MDAKVTLSFNQEIIVKAKELAKKQNISLSRMIEYLLDRAIESQDETLEKMYVSDWVHQLAEGRAEYHTKKRSRKSMKDEFLQSKK